MNPDTTAAHEKYQYKPFTGSSHSWALEILFSEPSTSKILDIGAGSGAIGQELREKNFQDIYAIEVDPKSKEHISGYYREITSDLQSLSQKSFDVILLLDVLEHVSEPKNFLIETLALLKPGGKILVSLPNVAHWSVRIPLLFGSFNYKGRGILDKTHVTFFTRKSAKKFLLASKQLSIQSMDASIEPLELILPRFIYKNPAFEALSKLRIMLARLLPGFFAFQNLFLLKRQ